MPQDRNRFAQLFPAKPTIGTIHLKALPGSPDYAGQIRPIVEAAVRDAEAYDREGCDGLIIENFFDAPFFKDQVGVETVAALAKMATIIRIQTKLPLGINVLRNDGLSAIAVATACECQFIRVNVLSWAMLTDQGIIEGKAAQILRFRRALQSDVLILADCLVKHAVPIAPQSMELVALDTWERGGADAIIVSGTGTGKATELADVVAARRGAPDAPILIGSGMTRDNVGDFLPLTDGFIVGTYFKRDGIVSNPVDPDRVRAFVQAKAHALSIHASDDQVIV